MFLGKTSGPHLLSQHSRKLKQGKLKVQAQPELRDLLRLFPIQKTTKAEDVAQHEGHGFNSQRHKQKTNNSLSQPETIDWAFDFPT